MTRNNQKELCSNFIDQIKATIIKEIEQGRFPETWDGFEIRWYVESAFNQNSMGNKKSKRFKDFTNYKNTAPLTY